MELKQIDQLLSREPMVGLEKGLGELFKPLPKMPKGLVDFLVGIAPFAAVIGGIATIWSGLSIMGIGRWGRWWHVGSWWYVEAIVMVLAGVLTILAYDGLKNKKIGGWRILFWVAMLRIVDLVMWFSVSSLLGMAISLYILFQVKGEYALGKTLEDKPKKKGK